MRTDRRDGSQASSTSYPAVPAVPALGSSSRDGAGEVRAEAGSETLAGWLVPASVGAEASHVRVSWQLVLQNKGVDPRGLACRPGFALKNIAE